jgi:uncharacterized NAD-dependent epimerase/dehydratase family protein
VNTTSFDGPQRSQDQDRTVGGPSALPGPYLLFLGDTVEPGFAKTAFGLRDWARDRCIGEYVLGTGTINAGLRQMTPPEAFAAGARALVIGVANQGGFIADSWLPSLTAALAAGLDIISGMHSRLSEYPELDRAAQQFGRRLIDVRMPPRSIPVATGRKRSGRRLLTVGTDCALGKKYSALAISRAFAARGVDCDFRATGQTGILIAGSGIPLDAVVADFAAGAAELLSPDASPDHWDVIEGQGSILHPSYAGVSLALLHGSQPDVFVVCHDPSRLKMLGSWPFPIPTVEEIIDLTSRLGSRTNSDIRCGGICLNTGALSEGNAQALIASEAARLNLPVADPMRGGAAFDQLISNCLGQ